MAHKKKLQRESSGIIHLRVGRETRSQLAALADITHRSSTDLAASAIEEFLDTVQYAKDIEAGLNEDYDIDDFIPYLGPRWVQRLLMLGIGGEAMKLSWRRHNEAISEMKAEIETDKAERQKKKEKHEQH